MILPLDHSAIKLFQNKALKLKAAFMKNPFISFRILLLLLVTLQAFWLSIECVPKKEPVRINLWYGEEQTFGHLGTPQRWVNILGNISATDSVVSACAVINQSDTMILSLGSDFHRLARQGDFNVDIDRDKLRVGENLIEIVATDSSGGRAGKTVKVHLHAGNTWPLPYEIHWAEVNEITDVAEIMDGKWELTPDGVRTSELYYDRILTIGDSTWSDYEVETTVIFHDFTPPAPGPPTYNVSHAAIASRFPGHDVDEHQPHRKWFPLGATSEFRLTTQLDSCRWRIFDGENLYVEQRPEQFRTIELDKMYGMKHRVETLTDGQTRYSVKLWPHDQAEPQTWDLIAIETPGNLPNGAALLIAHNADVTFGDVRVMPLAPAAGGNPLTKHQ